MATPDPFITPADIVNYVGRGGTADATMIMAADSACDIIRDYTGQDFNRGTATINLDGSGTDALLLPQLPVNSAGTVEVNGAGITDWVLADNGVLFRGTGTVYTNAVWPGGRQNVRVTYDHGWEIVDMPRSVRRIALEVAARTVLQGPLMEEYVGTVRTRFAAASTELTPTEMIILDNYKRR